jgi:hypothetical protein
MAAKTTTGQYWVVNMGTGVITVGPSYGAGQAVIPNVLGYTLHFRPIPREPYATATVQVQLEVIVYDTVSNAAIAKQAPQVIPNGYSDFKGFQPKKALRTRAGDVVCIIVNAGPSVNQQDFYASDSSVPFGQSGDATLVGTNT